MKAYPGWFMSTLLGILLVMLLTGLLLAPTTLSLRAEVEVPWMLPGSARVYVAALHAMGAFVSLFMLGGLWTVHMRSGWRRKRQRGSGLTMVLMLAALTFSAVGVYYLGDERTAMWVALLHLGMGMAAALPLLWHWYRGRRVRRGRQGRPVGRHGV